MTLLSRLMPLLVNTPLMSQDKLSQIIVADFVLLVRDVQKGVVNLLKPFFMKDEA